MQESPQYKCIFCLKSNRSFSKVEHIIPESLGNDDLTLDPGFVCDSCNQYFGSKIESKAINAPPFGPERTFAGIKTKKGKLASFIQPPDLFIESTGFKDQAYIFASRKYVFHEPQTNNLMICPPSHPKDGHFILRMLLKIGLELLITVSNTDPYSTIFNQARNYARNPKSNQSWELGTALYPHRDDLNLLVTLDEQGELFQQLLYQYEIGQMQSGDVVFCFIYRTHIFACNLSGPSLQEYCIGFNLRNEFQMHREYV